MRVYVTDTVGLSETYTPATELIENYPFLENERWDFVEAITIFDDLIIIDVWDKKINRIIWRWNGSRWSERTVTLKPNA